ncbi:MAG TPA: iron-containing alcohol dehydrogenase, partial [Pseudomonadota bacterium]|nr:iron-containing alcohol dehydrogenase [Pseudomonadota bacterium]
MTLSRFAFPTTIHFGPGSRKLVAEHLRVQGLQRPLIVTDRGIERLPLLEKFRAAMKGLDVAVYADVGGNPTSSQVAHGVRAYRAHGADSVVGLGGGAALDVAKAVALMAVHPGDILEYAWDHPE